jgi:hypothetical protein
MLLFTERYFRGCARRVGMPAWDGPESTFTLFMRTVRASVSRRIAHREIVRIERAFLAAARA